PGQSGTILVSGTLSPVPPLVNGQPLSNTATISTTTVTHDASALDDSSTATFFADLQPTVTINQAGPQPDPTNASPINFTVVFSEPVTGFTAADVDFTGSTVGGALAAIVTGGGSNYNVAVSGMTGDGLVVASIPAGAATDVDGLPSPSLASTSTDNT